METKSKGLKEQQQHHKKLLAAMLSQDSFDSVHSPAPSVAEQEMEDEDDAMELLGNASYLHLSVMYKNTNCEDVNFVVQRNESNLMCFLCRCIPLDSANQIP